MHDDTATANFEPESFAKISSNFSKYGPLVKVFLLLITSDKF